MQIIGKKEYQQKERTVLIRARRDKKKRSSSKHIECNKKNKRKKQGLQHIQNVNKVIEAKIKWVHIGCLCVYMHVH